MLHRAQISPNLEFPVHRNIDIQKHRSARSGIWMLLASLATLIASATPVLAAPPAPDNVFASLGTHPDKVAVFWTPSSGAIFRRTVNTPQGSIRIGDSITGITFNDFGALPGITYYYWLKAERGRRSGALVLLLRQGEEQQRHERIQPESPRLQRWSAPGGPRSADRRQRLRRRLRRSHPCDLGQRAEYRHLRRVAQHGQ